MKGFIFDLDGVIVKTDKLHYQAWKHMADSIGVYFDEEINNQLRGVSRSDSLNIILEKANKDYSIEEKNQLLIIKNNYYVKLLDSITESDILPGCVELIEYLKNRNYKIAIGSSSKNTKKILTRIGLINEFDAIADGTMIKNSKPDPEVFLLAAKLIGLDPTECAVIEDAISGIAAAKKAQMTAIAISDAWNSALADHYIDSLYDITKLY